MKKYLITYELYINPISEQAEYVYKKIKSFGAYIQMMENAWLVECDKTPEELSNILDNVHNELNMRVFKVFFICEITDTCEGRLFHEAWDFIKGE